MKVGGGDLRDYLLLDFCYFVVLMFCVAYKGYMVFSPVFMVVPVFVVYMYFS